MNHCVPRKLNILDVTKRGDLPRLLAIIDLNLASEKALSSTQTIHYMSILDLTTFQIIRQYYQKAVKLLCHDGYILSMDQMLTRPGKLL